MCDRQRSRGLNRSAKAGSRPSVDDKVVALIFISVSVTGDSALLSQQAVTFGQAIFDGERADGHLQVSLEW